MKPGQHIFPFSFTFPGNVPSSFRTYLNDANIQYKLKATAARSAFYSNFHAVKNVSVVRGFTHEALEYNQTLEIENTWPGKIMYCLTLPHKAFAAGDEIPISVKFMPLAKGTRVTHINSVIKEYTMVHTKHSSHPEVRIAATAKHVLRDGRAYKVTDRGQEPVAPPHHLHSHDTVVNGWSSVPTSAPASPRLGFASTPGTGFSSGFQTPQDQYLSRPGSTSNLAALGLPPPHSGPSSGGGGDVSIAAIPDDTRNADDEDINIGDEEIDTMITVPIPSWTTPSHNIHPVFVTHKIKWSCAISNPDGHVSELRCALPIHILPHSLLEEAQATTSATRALLFGGDNGEAQAMDLPSYNDHVYDRVANANNSQLTSGYVSTGHRTPGSGSRTPGSGHVTPAHSRGPSRPGSPSLRPSTTSGLAVPGGIDLTDALHAGLEVPPRPELTSWADSELLMSLGALAPHQGSNPPSQIPSPHETTPDESRASSRSTSRMGFRSGKSSAANSRAGSRASSPERQSASSASTLQHAGGSLANGMASIRRPLHERRTSSGIAGGGLFNLSSVKPFTAMMGKHTGSSQGPKSPSIQPPLKSNKGGLVRNGFSLGSHAGFTSLAAESQAQRREAQAASSSSSSSRAPPQPSPPTISTPTSSAPQVDPISQVPSYEVARSGFLGGGVTPLDAAPPDYDDSDRLERAKSETDLTQLARDHAEGNAPSISATLAGFHLGE